jgi:hypothetical protein
MTKVIYHMLVGVRWSCALQQFQGVCRRYRDGNSGNVRFAVKQVGCGDLFGMFSGQPVPAPDHINVLFDVFAEKIANRPLGSRREAGVHIVELEQKIVHQIGLSLYCICVPIVRNSSMLPPIVPSMRFQS